LREGAGEEEFMYLKLTKTDFDSLKFVVTRKQNDYQYLEKDDIATFIYGYPFNYATDSWLSANDVYQAYLRDGLSFVNDTEGVYSIIVLDKVKKKCFVIVDRYGIYSMFYLRNDDYIILSDVISEITAHMSNIRLNKEKIIEYLNFGFTPGNETHIEGIYEFESSRVYEINQELEMTERIYWESRGSLEEGRMTKEEFRAVFNKHIQTAMSLNKKVCSPLTGGLDTRTILSACISEKERLHCYTHGMKKAPDVRLAQTICQHFGIGHSFYELSKEWIKTIPSLAKKRAEVFNGLVPSVNIVHVEESYTKASAKGELLISGIMGNEIWRCLLGKKVVDSTNIDDVSLKITERVTGINPKVTGVYRDYDDKEVINLLKETVKTELLTAKKAKDPVALSETFVFRNYCSNWASHSLRAMGKHFKVFAACLHRDLIPQIYLMSLAEKTNGSIQKYIITKNSSYLASLPFDTGETITSNLGTRFRDFIRLLSVRFRAAVNLISEKILKLDIFRVYPFYTDYPGWLRRHHKEFILEVLSYEEMATRELFKRQELEKAVNLFLNGDNSLARFVVGLMSLEMWLKRVGETLRKPYQFQL
jgi:hypothetical protein